MMSGKYQSHQTLRPPLWDYLPALFSLGAVRCSVSRLLSKPVSVNAVGHFGSISRLVANSLRDTIWDDEVPIYRNMPVADLRKFLPSLEVHSKSDGKSHQSSLDFR